MASQNTDYEHSIASLPSELLRGSTYASSIALSDDEHEDDLYSKDIETHLEIIKNEFSESFDLSYAIPASIIIGMEEREQQSDQKSIDDPIYKSIMAQIAQHKVLIVFTISALTLYVYSWLYIGALWNPAARVNQLPVGLINSDKGFISTTPLAAKIRMAISKVTDNNLLGLFVAKQMINNPIRRINWKAVSDPDNHSLNDAIRKLQQNEYAAIVNIPYDFTEQFIHYIQYGLKDEPTIGPTPTLEYFYDHSRDHTLNTLLMQSMQQIIHQLNAQIRQDFYANDDTVEIIKNASTVIWSQPIELKNKPMYIEEQFGQGFSIHLQVLLTYVACTIIVLTLYHASPKLDEQADNLNCPIILCDFISDTARGIDCQGPWFSRSNLYRYLKGITGLAIFCLLIWSAPLCFYEFQLDGSYTSLSLLWLIYSGLAFIGLLSLLCLLVGIKLLPLASALLLLLLIPTSNILVDTALSPAFYQLGQGFPVFYAIRGLRFILFGSLQQLMWINCTVLLVWIIAPLLIHLIVMQWQHRQQRVQ